MFSHLATLALWTSLQKAQMYYEGTHWKLVEEEASLCSRGIIFMLSLFDYTIQMVPEEIF